MNATLLSCKNMLKCPRKVSVNFFKTTKNLASGVLRQYKAGNPQGNRNPHDLTLMHNRTITFSNPYLQSEQKYYYRPYSNGICLNFRSSSLQIRPTNTNRIFMQK